jgi:hypothetical protein
MTKALPTINVKKDVPVASISEGVKCYQEMMEAYNALSEEDRNEVDAFNKKLIENLIDCDDATLSTIDEMGESPMDRHLKR